MLGVWTSVWDYRREEQQMYKIIQLLQPARRVYDTYDGFIVVPALNQLKHE